MAISNEIVLNLIIARCIETRVGNLRWIIRLEPNASADLTAAVRMDRGNTEIQGYYLLPRIELACGSIRLTEDNGVFLDAFRFDSLDYPEILAQFRSIV